MNNTTVTKSDIDYMQTWVWDEHFSNDDLKKMFTSLYARDGRRSYGDVAKAFIRGSDKSFDTVIDILINIEAQIDRFFLDLLLPLQAHLDDWNENADAIDGLLDELDSVVSLLAQVIYGAQAPAVRDGFNEAKVPQRLMAYRATQLMVAGKDGLGTQLEAITGAVKANLEYLLLSDDVDTLYTSSSQTVGGNFAMGTQYWCEPLYIVAEAAKATGYKDALAEVIDKVVDHLASIQTEHEEVREKINGDLTKFRSL